LQGRRHGRTFPEISGVIGPVSDPNPSNPSGPPGPPDPSFIDRPARARDPFTSPANLALVIDAQIESLQREITALKDEINMLRRKDETLNFHMVRLDEEMRLAAKLQQDFLPRSLPQVGPVHFHTLFRPAGYVSGDLYDVMRLDEQHVGFFVADAVGHGMPAALLTMFIKRALVTKQIIPGGYRLLPPGETMARLNDALVEQDLTQATFATALYGFINTQTLTITFARSGHPSPLLLGASGDFRTIDADGGLLGIFPNEQYAQATLQLAPGDRFLIYSDGLEVAFSDDEIVDTQRWRRELLKRRALTSEALLTDFAAHLDAENGSLAPKDDVTMILLEVK
jgi:sigma-B regulation protein RsbU (phosphoserine phosphatase)